MKTLLTALLLAGGLAAKGKKPAEPPPPPPVATGDASATLAEADALWAGRVDPETLKAALAKYEEAWRQDPGNRLALERLTRGWYFLGDAHTSDKATKIELWATAMTWGDKCLALNAQYQGRVDGGEKPKDAATSMGKADVACMYWYATALGKWGKIQGIAKALANLPTVKAFIGRAEELDAEHFYFGPARYWGTYYAVLPSFAGQDLVKSAAYFDASVQGAPDYLATRVLRAENLSPKVGNIDQFYDDLNAVLAFDPTTTPDVQPENTLEQAKARDMLAHVEEYFDAKTIEAYQAAHPQ